MSTIVVTDFGPMGTLDDTATVQAAIDASCEGDEIFFPQGVYTVNNFGMGPHMSKRRLYGENATLKQAKGSYFATITECDDLRIDHLRFDANGVLNYGGVTMYGCRGGHIHDNLCYDSDPQPAQSTDRYSFVLARGTRPHERMNIYNNVISHLQLEVDFIKHSTISGNQIAHSVNTAGIGMFSVDPATSCENIDIVMNTIIDGRGSSIMVAIDPPQSANCAYRDIRIIGNKIYRRAQSGPAIRIGTGNVTVASRGNIFEGFQISKNEIEYFESATPGDGQAMIWLIAGAQSGFTFRDFSIHDNRLKGPGVGMGIRRLENSRVQSNTMDGMDACMAIGDRFARNLISANVAKPKSDGAGYIIEDSAGLNVIVDNAVVGGDPAKRYMISQPNGTDLIEES